MVCLNKLPSRKNPLGYRRNLKAFHRFLDLIPGLPLSAPGHRPCTQRRDCEMSQEQTCTDVNVDRRPRFRADRKVVGDSSSPEEERKETKGTIAI